MRTVERILLAVFSLLFLSSSTASSIPYCNDAHVSPVEDEILQKLIPIFARKMRCEIGDNCLSKFDTNVGLAKFSIAWNAQCGPVIAGHYQLGDEGHGSTFVCGDKDNKTCCWPVGYNHLQEFVMCPRL